MNPITAVASLVSGVIDYFTMSKEAKMELKKTKENHKLEMAKRKQSFEQSKLDAETERITRRDNSETAYDIMALQNAQTSIIDEVMIAWVLTVVSMIFVPSTQQYVIDGFIALKEHVPVWFQLVFVGGFISKLGLRFLFSGHSLFGKKV